MPDIVIVVSDFPRGGIDMSSRFQEKEKKASGGAHRINISNRMYNGLKGSIVNLVL